jgi:hypothetical protein
MRWHEKFVVPIINEAVSIDLATVVIGLSAHIPVNFERICDNGSLGYGDTSTWDYGSSFYSLNAKPGRADLGYGGTYYALPVDDGRYRAR